MDKWTTDFYCPIRNRSCIFDKCVGVKFKRLAKLSVKNLFNNYKELQKIDVKNILFYENKGNGSVVFKKAFIYTLYCQPLRTILPFICLITEKTDENVSRSPSDCEKSKKIMLEKSYLKKLFKEIINIYIKSNLMPQKLHYITFEDIEDTEEERIRICKSL